MTVETKYSIGDIVYYMDLNEIKSFKIESVLINKHTYMDSKWPSQEVQYSDDQYGKDRFKEEHNLFSSVEELITNLKKKFKI